MTTHQGNTPDDELDPAQLERLMEDVSRLPREVPPSRDAWPSIRQRIEAQRVREIAPGAGIARKGIPRWWIAAAATVIVAAGLMLNAPARGKSFPNPPVAVERVPQGRGSAAPVAPVSVSLATVNPSLARAIAQYQEASRDLEAEVAARSARLSPATREVVRRSLATIDTAIADLRAALGENPRDAAAGQSLSLVYERKLEFLKRVRTLPGTGM